MISAPNLTFHLPSLSNVIGTEISTYLMAHLFCLDLRQSLMEKKDWFQTR